MTKEKLKRLAIILEGTLPCILIALIYGSQNGLIAFYIMIWFLTLFGYYFDSKE